MITAFLKRFGDITIEHIEKVGKKYYQQPPKLKATVDALTDYPTSAGLFLGENQKNQSSIHQSRLNLASFSFVISHFRRQPHSYLNLFLFQRSTFA